MTAHLPQVLLQRPPCLADIAGRQAGLGDGAHKYGGHGRAAFGAGALSDPQGQQQPDRGLVVGDVAQFFQRLPIRRLQRRVDLESLGQGRQVLHQAAAGQVVGNGARHLGQRGVAN